MIDAFGLIGPFQPPKFYKGYTSVLMMNENSTSSLFVFIMFPGAYDDVYEIASKPRFKHVFLVPVSLNADYLSDVHRLVTDLTPLKTCVKVIYPTPYGVPVNSINEVAIIRGDSNKCTYTFDDGFIAFDYKISSTNSSSVGCCPCCKCGSNTSVSAKTRDEHDIYLRYNDKRFLFTSTVVDKERILDLLDNDQVDYVYVPYSDGYVEQDTFLTIVNDERFALYDKHLIAYGFNNLEEIDTCYLNYRFSTPRTFRWVFAHDVEVIFPDTSDLVIGDGVYCPSVYFPAYQKPPIDTTPEDPNKPTNPPEDPIIDKNPDEDKYVLSELDLSEKITRPSADTPFRIYLKVREDKKTYDKATGEVTEEKDIVASVNDVQLYYYDKEGNYIRITENIMDFEDDVTIHVFGLNYNRDIGIKNEYYVESSYNVTALAYTIKPEEPTPNPDQSESTDPKPGSGNEGTDVGDNEGSFSEGDNDGKSEGGSESSSDSSDTTPSTGTDTDTKTDSDISTLSLDSDSTTATSSIKKSIKKTTSTKRTTKKKTTEVV